VPGGPDRSIRQNPISRSFGKSVQYEVTTIPDDTGSTREGTGVSERMQGAVDSYDSVAHRAEDSTRRILAAVQGALEGFVEALDKYDVANEGQRALQQAGEISRVAAAEGSWAVV
jgi:hypothetical protein